MWVAKLSNAYYKYFIIEWIIYIPCLLYMFFPGTLYYVPFIPNQIEHISIGPYSCNVNCNINSKF